MTTADWIVPGAKVAEYDSHYYEARVVLTTIEKLTATQVVLANGARYRRDKTSYGDGLRAVGAGRRTLLPLTDQRVRDAIARQYLATVRHRVDSICREQRGGTDAVLGALDQIAEAVDEVRGKLAELEAAS